MKWIELTKFSTKQKYAIKAELILAVYDQEEGCCIVTQEERAKLNTHVSQSYDDVLKELNAE